MKLSDLWQYVRSHFHRPKPAALRLFIVSFVCAVAVWLYIATNISNRIELHFSGIPVTAELAGTQAEAYGLTLLTDETDFPTINVVISGKRTSIGAVSRGDVIAYVDFDRAADQIGAQSLPILLKTKDGTPLSNYTLSQDTLEVTMDRYQTMSFPVSEVVAPALTYDNGVNLADIVCEPSTVTISGPTLSLAQIDHVRVTVPDAVKLYETKSFSDCSNYDLMDAEGNVITDTAFQVQATRFLVKVSVFYTHTLPVTIDLSGVPPGFDTSTIRARLRLNTDAEYVLPGYGDHTLDIVIKTADYEDKRALDTLESWSLGTVPLSSLTLGGTPIEVPVTMEEGYEDYSNLGSVYVSLDETDLVAETRWINTKDITVVNGAPNYDYSVQSGRFQITIIGERDEVAKIAAEDIIATINLYNAAITEQGTFAQTVSFTLPDAAHGVWVSGSTKLNVTATPSAATTTDSPVAVPE